MCGYLLSGIEFVEELRPTKERLFRIDIALSQIMLAIEVNGRLHYTDMEKEILTPYHAERQAIIQSLGWETIEVRHDKVYRSEYVSELLGTIRQRLANQVVTGTVQPCEAANLSASTKDTLWHPAKIPNSLTASN